MSDVKGYNKYFVATDSIASKERHEYGAYEWGTDTQGNIIGTRLIQDASINNAKIGTAAIGTANIGTLTFNQISGGTANFGGSSNGDGVINVFDSGGTQVGKWDKDGIEVKNSSGTTFIDGSGLVSTANFISNSIVSLNNGRTTTSTTFVDVGSTSLTFVLQRSTKVLFMCSGDFANPGTTDNQDGRELVALNIDGTLYPDSTNGFGMVYFSSDTSGGDLTVVQPTWGGHYLATLTAGTHTAKLQFCKQDTPTVSATARVLNTQLTYLVLGS